MNIKKIIKEEIDNFDWVDKGVETPLSWLINNFGDLTPVIDDDKTFYADDNGKPFFYYYQDNNNNGLCYISYNKIWEVLKTRFRFNNTEVKEVITKWLEEVYGLTGLTPCEHYGLNPIGRRKYMDGTYTVKVK
jgi:hypothetical protein